MTDWNGVPENPERDGWHWVRPTYGVGIDAPKHWLSRVERWELSDGTFAFPHECSLRWHYLGSCLTPADLAAHAAASAEAMRKEMQAEEQQLARIIVAADLMQQATALGPDWAATMQLGLDCMGLSDALASALAQARREGMEAAADMVDCGCAARVDVLARLAEAGERKARNCCVHGDVCCALEAAAIRAAAQKEVGE